MAISTDVPIYTTTLGSAAAAISVDLSAYQDYRNLKIVASPLCNTASNLTFQFNGDTGGNYSTTIMWGNASTTGSARQVNPTVPYLQYYGYSGTSKSLATINLFDYSNSSKHKTFLSRAGQPDSTMGTSGVDSIVGTWRNNAAITSIVFKFTGGANFEAGTRIDIYGVGVKTPTAKATGGAIYSDANYMYHVFTSTASFTPTQSLSCDVMLVAGGGGGGARVGGGGGAGGYRLLTGISASATPYTITVGSGGAGQIYGGSVSTNGTNSTALSNSSTGGGRGGDYSSPYTGYSGGSGGGGNGNGASVNAGGSGNAGSYSPVEGYAGGTGYPVAYHSGGGGGGGAGGAGSNGANAIGGAGGAGIAVSSAWLAATGIGQSGYIAAGGGGGTESGDTWGIGGTGGGGTGSNSSIAATAGTINTGSGGGGGGCCSSNQNGGNGGSGIVIVRYAK